MVSGEMKIWQMYNRKFAGNSPPEIAQFENVVDKYGLKLRYKIRKPRTTDSTHGLPTYPNLIKNFMSIGPNQLWLSDITYIPIFNGDINYWFCYLSIIMDAYTEEIKGYCVGNSI